MNNIVMKVINCNGGVQALSTTPLVASVTVSCPPTNGGTVQFMVEGGNWVPWQPGEWHEFESVNLAELKLSGTPGDIVTVVGGTW